MTSQERIQLAEEISDLVIEKLSRKRSTIIRKEKELKLVQYITGTRKLKKADILK